MADHYRVKIKGTNQVYNFKNGESLDQVRAVVGIESIKQRLSREMSHAPGPEITALMTTLDQYVGDVMSGKIALDGIKRIDDIAVRMMQGDTSAALEMVGEFGGIGSVAGRFAKMANLKALGEAKELSTAGTNRQDVFDATGWWKSVDDKWKFEIDDSGANFNNPFSIERSAEKLTDDFKIKEQAMKQGIKDRNLALKTQPDMFRGDLRKAHGDLRRESDQEFRMLDRNFGPLSTARQGNELAIAYDHPELFKSYPRLGEKTIVRQGGEGGLGVKGSHFDDQIDIYRAGMADNPKSTLAHETQHAVQDVEGFARGGSPGMFRDEIRETIDDADLNIKRLNIMMRDNARSRDVLEANKYAEPRSREGLKKTEDEIKLLADEYQELITMKEANIPDAQFNVGEESFKRYQRLAGEAEARAVQKRMDMTPAERKARPFWKDLDIPEEDQIVRF